MGASSPAYSQTEKSRRNSFDLHTLPYMGPLSWSFVPAEGRLFMHADPDQDCYVEYLYELYQLVDPDYEARATVPVLWDKQQQTIVSNESAEIARMFNSEFAALGASDIDLYPTHLQREIDELNALLYRTVNNGVYRAGFATTQAAYEEAVWPLFATLDQMEARLGKQRFLCGADITEADLRLFPTLVRFDAVYAGHFNVTCADYRHPTSGLHTRYFPAAWHCRYCRHSVQQDHYYGSHATVNPTGVILLDDSGFQRSAQSNPTELKKPEIT